MAPRTLPVGIFIAEDGNGAEIRANRRAVELMGQHSTGDKLISVPAILPLTLNGVKVNAEDQPLRKAIRTGKPIPGYEAQILHENDSGIDVMMSANPLFDENRNAARFPPWKAPACLWDAGRPPTRRRP